MDSPMMQFPFLIPTQMFGAQRPYGHALGNEVPARVRVATEYLQALTFKQMTRAAVNDMSIEQIPGQALTPAEEAAAAQAADLLDLYFSGKLKPSEWETALVDASKTQGPPPGVPGRVIMCPGCHGQGGVQQSRCVLCQAGGRVLIYPLAANGPQVPEVVE